MEKKVRNQFLIGGLIMLVGIGMYFSGITPGQVTECDPRIAGGGIEDCRDYSAFERSTICTAASLSTGSILDGRYRLDPL